jgi:hypothetical protein
LHAQALINDVVEGLVAEVLVANWPTKNLGMGNTIELFGRIRNIGLGLAKVVPQVLTVVLCVRGRLNLYAINGAGVLADSHLLEAGAVRATTLGKAGGRKGRICHNANGCEEGSREMHRY